MLFFRSTAVAFGAAALLIAAQAPADAQHGRRAAFAAGAAAGFVGGAVIGASAAQAQPVYADQYYYAQPGYAVPARRAAPVYVDDGYYAAPAPRMMRRQAPAFVGGGYYAEPAPVVMRRPAPRFHGAAYQPVHGMPHHRARFAHHPHHGPRVAAPRRVATQVRPVPVIRTGCVQRVTERPIRDHRGRIVAINQHRSCR